MAEPGFTTAVDLVDTGHATGMVFMCNTFNPTIWPAARWQSTIMGQYLEASWSDKVLYLALGFLKIGDEIVSYKLVGDATETTALTLDCQLVRVNKADPITHSDIDGGDITQITTGGNFDAEATLTDVETVATDKMYILEITGTTGSGDTIYVMGAEVTVNRRV